MMAAEVTCCSAFYEQDWVRELTNDNFHPGGEELTRRTVAVMGLPQAAVTANPEYSLSNPSAPADSKLKR